MSASVPNRTSIRPWRRFLAGALLLAVPAIGGAQLAAHIRDAADTGKRWTENTTLTPRVHDHSVCVLLDHSRAFAANVADQQVAPPDPVPDPGQAVSDHRPGGPATYEVRPRAPPHLS